MKLNVGLDKLLGTELVYIEKGKCEIKLQINENHYNPGGIVHGGCMFAMADTAGAHAALAYGENVVTATSDIKYLRPAKNVKYLRAVAREIKHGKNIFVYEVDIIIDDGRYIAKVGLTYFVLAGREDE